MSAKATGRTPDGARPRVGLGACSACGAPVDSFLEHNLCTACRVLATSSPTDRTRTTVHILEHALTLCGAFVEPFLAPTNWPYPHAWIGIDDPERDEQATCRGCLLAVVKRGHAAHRAAIDEANEAERQAAREERLRRAHERYGSPDFTREDWLELAEQRLGYTAPGERSAMISRLVMMYSHEQLEGTPTVRRYAHENELEVMRAELWRRAGVRLPEPKAAPNLQGGRLMLEAKGTTVIACDPIEGRPGVCSVHIICEAALVPARPLEMPEIEALTDRLHVEGAALEQARVYADNATGDLMRAEAEAERLIRGAVDATSAPVGEAVQIDGQGMGPVIAAAIHGERAVRTAISDRDEALREEVLRELPSVIGGGELASGKTHVGLVVGSWWLPQGSTTPHQIVDVSSSRVWLCALGEQPGWATPEYFADRFTPCEAPDEVQRAGVALGDCRGHIDETSGRPPL